MSRELMVEGFNVLKMFTSNKSKEPHFGMFSKRGNKAVNDIVVEVMKHPTATDEQKYKMADAMLAKLRVRFGEAQDTAVRDAVWTAISSQHLNEDGYKTLAAPGRRTEAQRRAPEEGPYFEIIGDDRLFRKPPAGFGLIAQPLSTTIKYGLPVLGAAAAATAVGRLQKAAFPKSQNPVAPLLAGLGGYVLSRKASQKTSDIALKNIYKGMKKVGL